jgi:hypothetical protein
LSCLSCAASWICCHVSASNVGGRAASRWAQRPRVWWLAAIGNSGAMTPCLWHMPALLGMHLVFDALGLPRYDAGARSFVAMSVERVVLMTVGTTRCPGATAASWPGETCAAPRSELAVHRRNRHAGVRQVGAEGRRTTLRRGPRARADRCARPGHRFEGAGTERRARLAALAAELPSMFGRALPPRLLGAGVLVLLAAGRAGVLAFQRLAELAFGVALSGGISRVRGRTVVRCHVHRLTRYRTPGGIPYTWEIGSRISTRRSVTIARRYSSQSGCSPAMLRYNRISASTVSS